MNNKSRFVLKVLAGQVFLPPENRVHLVCPVVGCGGEKIDRQTLCPKCLEKFGHKGLIEATREKDLMRQGFLPQTLADMLNEASETAIERVQGGDSAQMFVIRRANEYFAQMPDEIILKSLAIVRKRKEIAENFRQAKEMVGLYLNDGTEHYNLLPKSIAKAILANNKPEFACTPEFLAAAAEEYINEAASVTTHYEVSPPKAVHKHAEVRRPNLTLVSKAA